METTDDESIVVEVTQDDNFEIIKMEEAFEEIPEENNSPILILDDISPANNELDLNAKDISNSENDPIIIVASLNTNELIVDDLKFNIDKNKEVRVIVHKFPMENKKRFLIGHGMQQLHFLTNDHK